MDLEEIYLSYKEKHSKELSKPIIERDNKIMQKWLMNDAEKLQEKQCICGKMSKDDFCENCNKYFEMLKDGNAWSKI